MELLTYKDKDFEYTYYLDKNGNQVFHGEYKTYHPSAQWREHSFVYHGKWHGECKCWDERGNQAYHCFYINGELYPYVEMNEHEKLLFQIKYPGFRFLPAS